MLNKSKAWALGLLLAIATAGFAGGAASTNWLGHRGGSRESCSYSGTLQRELGLTEAQRDSVRAILVRHRPAMRALFEVVRPQIDSIRAVVHQEVAGVLTPAQRETYQRLLARERAERAERARQDSASGRGR